MKRLVRFFSFAVLTQLVLLLNQVVLLPIQLRIWGTEATALWYASLALATITTFADLGLRTAGHVALLRYVNDKDESEGLHIKQVWAWIRVMVCGITVFLLGWSVLRAVFGGEGAQPLLTGPLTVASAIETLLIIRIIFLDSLGHYSDAESTYFVFAMLRFSLALPALLLFKAPPRELALLFLVTSFFGIVLQERLCRRVGVLGLLDPLPSRLSFGVLATARHTMAEPLSNWLRLSLPVLVIASISTPAAVTVFVALRAVFSASRTTIQQLARVASVEYLRMHAFGQAKRAKALLTAFVQGAGFLGAAIGGFVIVDNLRILGLWLKHFEPNLFHMIAASFAFSGAFCAYQIFVGLLFRVGSLAEVAHRQYAFIVYSGVFSVVSVVLKSLSVYLWLIVISEVLLAGSFMLLRRSTTSADCWLAGQRGVIAAVAGVLLLATLRTTVDKNPQGIFTSTSFAGEYGSVGTLLIRITALGIFQVLLNLDMFGRPLWPKRPNTITARQIKYQWARMFEIDRD